MARQVTRYLPGGARDIIEALGPSTFTAPPRRVVGLFGELEKQPEAKYALPAAFSPTVLAAMSDDDLAGLLSEIEMKRRETDQSRYGQQLFQPGSEEYKNRQRTEEQFDEFLANLYTPVKTAIEQRATQRIDDTNRAIGSLAGAGVEFVPGFLADGANRDALYQARGNLNQWLNANTGVARMGGWNAYQLQNLGLWSGADDPFGVKAREFNDAMNQQPREEGVTFTPPQRMPYNPADPLAEAEYYGGGPRRSVGPGMYSDVFQPPEPEPQRRVFEPPQFPKQGMELRPGVRVRNPFDVRRVGPRPSRSMFS